MRITKHLVMLILAMILAVPAWGEMVTLAWDSNAESDLAGYRFYSGLSSGQYDSMIDVGNETTYWMDVPEGVTAYFAVTAYDAAGNESGYSNEVSHSTPLPPPPPDTTPPADPTNLREVTETPPPPPPPPPGDGVAITSAPSIMAHADTITIVGDGFGVKAPATPLVWDPCNGAASLPGQYLDVWPKLPADDHWALKYRDLPFEPTPNVDTVYGPHPYCSRILAGGHKQTGTTSHEGRNVTFVVAGPGNPTRWFCMWYERTTMPPAGSACYSHKFCRFQSEDAYCTGNTTYIQWNQYSTSGATLPAGMGAQCSIKLGDTFAGGRGYLDMLTMPNPNRGWIHAEVNLINEAGPQALLRVGGNNQFAVDYGNTTDIWSFAPNSFSIGDFFRQDGCESDYVTHDDAWRLWADIYIDTTLARVMLGNAATYDQCTVIEPQIPSAWSDRAIMVTVNKGRLPTGTAYLYVFNADNNHNEAGYPITVE